MLLAVREGGRWAVHTLAEGASVSLMNILLRPATGLNE